MSVNIVQKHVELVNLQEEQRPHGSSRNVTQTSLGITTRKQHWQKPNCVRSGPSTKAFSYS